MPKNTASMSDADDEDHDHRLVDPDEVGVLVALLSAAPMPMWPGMPAMSSPAIRLRHANAHPCFKPPTTDGSAAGTTT